MKITLASFTLSPAPTWGSAPKVRIWADRRFQATTGEVHPAGSESENYQAITLEAAGLGWEFPSTELDTTDDSSDPNATYSAAVFNGNKNVYPLFDRWAFRASLGTYVAYSDLEAANVTRVPLRDDTAYSKVQTDLRIQNALTVSTPATATTPGTVRVSVPPVDAATPIAVGDNDPRLISSLAYALLSLLTAVTGTIKFVTDRLRGLYYKTLSGVWASLMGWANVLDHGCVGDGTTDNRAALHTLANTTLATTGGVIYFPHESGSANTDYLVGSDMTFPGNVVLKFAPGARLKAGAGATVTVLGEPRGARQLFTGSGAFALPSNNCPYDIRPRWFAAGSGTLADPYTEWHSRCTWGGNTYRFSKEFYEYPESPVFSYPGIHLYGEGAYLIYTGSGAAINMLSSSRAPGAHTFGAYMENFIVQGLNASHGLYVQTTLHSAFKRIRVRNLPGIAFFFKSSNWDVLESLTSNDPIGDSIIGDQYPAVTIVPTAGLVFAAGAVFPGDSPTNNAMTVIDINLSYINGRGVDIESLISSCFFGGAVERCIQEGVVITGNVAATNSVSFIGTEVEFNNGSGSDIYTNANNISFRDMFCFNAVVSIDNGAQNTLLQGGTYDTINISASAHDTALKNLSYDFSGSGDISDAGQRTSYENVIHRGTGKPYAYSLRNLTVQTTLAGATVESTTLTRGVFTITAAGFALGNDALTGSARWKMLFRGVFYDSTNGGAFQQNAPYVEVTSESPSLDLGGGVSLTFAQEGGGNRRIIMTAAGATTIGFAGTIELIPTSYGPAGSESINVKGHVKTLGHLAGRRNVAAKTSGYTVAAADARSFFTNAGAGAGVTFTLPTPSVGMEYEFYRDANQAVTVDIGAGVTIRVGASATTDGGNVTLDAVGSRLRIVAISTTQWVGELTGAATFN